MGLVLILVALIAFIVLSTTRLKLHPFLALLAAALIAGFAYQLPGGEIIKTMTAGFGGILGYIGIVIVLGTIIGVILERSGAAITMAETVIRLLGQRFPTLTMSIIGYLVSIPVFCDSGYVILNSLKNALAARMKVSVVAMSVALATGLYATHTFVPPTPGPIAAAGNLGLETSLGLVILVGLLVAAVTAVAGMLWANRFLKQNDHELLEEAPSELLADNVDFDALRARYGKLPSAWQAFSPIFVPIILICLGSLAAFPSKPFGTGAFFDVLSFLGQPVAALLVGLVLACSLLKGEALARFIRTQTAGRQIENMRLPLGIVAADLQSGAPILFRRGDPGTAVRASSAVPAVFEPVRINGREYIDGGAVSPIPVRFARQMGADVVIAVDISAIPQGQPTKRAVDILLQTFNIMGHAISQHELADADVVMRPKLEGIGSADFSARRLSILAGREAALMVLPQLKERIVARTR